MDPVRVDVAVPASYGSILIRDMSFFRQSNGGLDLLPATPDLFVLVNLFGLDLSMIPPWNRWDERCEGLERAAGEVAWACRTSG